jgi:tetratricopeptide (TPR) repeat protein
MATRSRKSADSKEELDQSQDQEVSTPTHAEIGGEDQPNSDPNQEDRARTATSALQDLPERMARVVREQREQGTPTTPGEGEERKPSPRKAQQQVQQSDEKRRPRHGGERRSKKSRPDHERQGERSMATDESNPTYAARAALLRMARQWRDTGSTHQALEAYEQILTNYPGTQVAAAATEELVQLAQMMEDQGQFHSALEVFKKLERYGAGR